MENEIVIKVKIDDGTYETINEATSLCFAIIARSFQDLDAQDPSLRSKSKEWLLEACEEDIDDPFSLCWVLDILGIEYKRFIAFAQSVIDGKAANPYKMDRVRKDGLTKDEAHAQKQRKDAARQAKKYSNSIRILD